MNFRINIKPLSVNKAWQGRRFKTKEYIVYEKYLLLAMPMRKLPLPPYHIDFEFGFSNMASDVDNPIKLISDILQKRYKFNDSKVTSIYAEKKIVKKGDEYFSVTITTSDV